MSTAEAYFAGLAHQIRREERIQRSWADRAENALTLWEARSEHADARTKEMGDGTAANLRGTPIKDCPRAQSLCTDLEWLLTKIPA